MKIYKRLLALIMTLSMAFSLSTVTFAAEPEENNVIEIEELSTAQSNIETMSTNALLTPLSATFKGNKRTTITVPITVEGNGSYLYFAILTKGPVKGTLYSNGVAVSTTYISANIKDVQWCQIKLDRSPQLSCWAPGEYKLIVEVMFNYEYTFAIYGSPDELPK